MYCESALKFGLSTQRELPFTYGCNVKNVHVSECHKYSVVPRGGEQFFRKFKEMSSVSSQENLVVWPSVGCCDCCVWKVIKKLLQFYRHIFGTACLLITFWNRKKQSFGTIEKLINIGNAWCRIYYKPCNIVNLIVAQHLRQNIHIFHCYGV